MSSGVEIGGRLVLDTSAYSHFRYGDERVLDALAVAQAVILPATVLGELEAGFEGGRRARENRRLLDEFLDEPFVTHLSTSPPIARQYGRVFQQLKRIGHPIPTNDMWIAAATIQCDGQLLTFDGHFSSIETLDAIILQP